MGFVQVLWFGTFVENSYQSVGCCRDKISTSVGLGCRIEGDLDYDILCGGWS